MSEQVQGIIKCGRGEGGFEYQGHNRAGIFFSRHGREFIVDDQSIARLRAAAEKEMAELEKARPAQTAPVHEHQEYQERLERLRARQHGLRTGHVDEPDKPLMLTHKLYEYLREANGRALMFEPWDGRARPEPPSAITLSPADRLAALEAGQSELRALIQQLLSELGRKK